MHFSTPFFFITHNTYLIYLYTKLKFNPVSLIFFFF